MSPSAVRAALVAPETFARQAAEAPPAPGPAWLPIGSRADLSTMAALAATASLGVGAYGAAMHAHAGLARAASQGLLAVAAAGGAWCATLPALYVLGTLSGSRLAGRVVALGALVTVSFGGLAMLASVPVLWFVELCLPHGWARLLVALVSFAGVGLSMADVFLRVMGTLEGPRFRHLAWLLLLGLVGAELFWVVGLFDLFH
jgi:hypothetical protein